MSWELGTTREEKYADLKAGVRADESLKDRAGKEKAWGTSEAGEQGRDLTLASGISTQFHTGGGAMRS